MKEQEYVDKARIVYQRIEYQDMKSVDEEKWKEFRDAALKCASEVCGYRRVGQGITKGGEWWNDKVRNSVLQKRNVLEQLLYRPFQGPCAVDRIEAGFREEPLSLVAHVQRHACFHRQRLHTTQLDLDDHVELPTSESIEKDDLVDSVEELRKESNLRASV